MFRVLIGSGTKSQWSVPHPALRGCLLGAMFFTGCGKSNQEQTASIPSTTQDNTTASSQAESDEAVTSMNSSPKVATKTASGSVTLEAPASPMGDGTAATTASAAPETPAQTNMAVATESHRDSASVSDRVSSDSSSPLQHPASEFASKESSTAGYPTASEVGLENAIRVLLPTTAGPLVVAIDLRIGDLPLQQAFEQRILQVIEEAGEGDELTWNRLYQHVAGDTRQFGRMPINASQYQNMTRTYDKNRNKRPDPDEVARFLFRNAGFSAAFRLFGSNHFRDVNRSQSALFRAIDANENRMLEPNEVDAAARTLMALDRDGDRRIVAEEVVNNEVTNDAWQGRRSSRWGEVAMDLIGYIDWTMVAYTLEDIPKQEVFSDQLNVIAKLDQDDDGSIASAEARELLHAQPDIAIQVQYATKTDGYPKVHLLWASPSVRENAEVEIRESDFSIVGPQMRLVVRATDVGAPNNQIPPDAFAALDANNDGGLDESEIPEGVFQEYSFADLDADGDDKLTLEEIRRGMIPEAPIWGVQIRGRGAEAPDGVFAWLDQDRNGILSERETIQVVDRLKQITKNQPDHDRIGSADEGSVIRATSLPDTFELHLTRGDPSQADQLFQVTNEDRQTSKENWPRWAESMDTNRDGDISRQEFLGSDEHFDALDHDRDGFIHADEL